MRLFELKNNLKSRPIVYVDMDGVLADFFGEIARDHGVPHWKDIKRGETAIVQSARKPGFFAKLPVLPNAQKPDQKCSTDGRAIQYSQQSTAKRRGAEQSGQKRLAEKTSRTRRTTECDF
jgi:hypothetical protein